MGIWVLSPNLKKTNYIDQISSLLWNEKYDEAGDFELVLPATQENISTLTPDSILVRDGSNTGMFVDKVSISTHSEEGNSLTVKGMGLPYILSKRVILTPETVSGSLNSVVRSIIQDNALTETLGRSLEILKYQENSDINYSNMSVSKTDVLGENLFTEVKSLVRKFGLGFLTFYDESSEKLIFKMIQGRDLSGSDPRNPIVRFSTEFENLMSSDYNRDSRDTANVAVVLGKSSRSSDEDVEKSRTYKEKHRQVNRRGDRVITTVTTNTHTYNNRNSRVYTVTEVESTTKSDDGTYELKRTDTTEKAADPNLVVKSSTVTDETRTVKSQEGPNKKTTKTVTHTSYNSDISGSWKSEKTKTVTVTLNNSSDELITETEEKFFLEKSEGTVSRPTIVYSFGDSVEEYMYPSGMSRSETFLEVTDSRVNEDGSQMTDKQYSDMLWDKGHKARLENAPDISYTVKTVPHHNLVFGKDYDLGDIVQVVGPFGMPKRVRISEVLYSYSKDKIEVLPTFTEV